MMMVLEKDRQAESSRRHIPVMSREVQDWLNLGEDSVYVDCTLGLGGHASLAADVLGTQGHIIGIDRDTQALDIARKTLSDKTCRIDLVHSDFRYIDQIIASHEPDGADGILMDLGVSSLQLDDPARGFSFRDDGPLDMRMDQENFISAYDLVNSLSEKEISSILEKYGEERFHNRIARFLVSERAKRPIATTKELGDIVIRALPGGMRHYRHHRIHPATRTFQAFRIAVNRELESLEIALEKSVEALKVGGRLCVIAFHSLEDRIVKLKFRQWAKEGYVEGLTKKPIRPTEEEVAQNTRARSARLRVIEKRLESREDQELCD